MFRLALRNVFRHRGRTAVTLAAIVFGVAGIILSGGFVRDILVQLGEAVIHSQSGHIQVSRIGFRAEGSRKPERYVIASPDQLSAQIAALPMVADVMARTSFSALLNNGRADLAIVGEGIDPERESRLGTHIAMVAGRRLAGSDVNGVMLGQGVAKALNLAPGDRATLVTTTGAGAMNTVDVEVVGVFQSFSKDYDARVVKVPLAVAQELTDSMGANTLVVSLRRTDETETVAELLRERLRGADLEVTTWPQLNDFYEKTVTLYDRQFGVLQLIILVSVMLSVANSVNMSIFERVPEFGTMRVLGNPTRSILLLVACEALLLGLIGGALGVIVGAILAATISAIGIPMPPPPNSDLSYVARIQYVPTVILGAFLVGVLAAVVAGALSAVRIMRIPIAAALRKAT
jgi:putative ABC transport system permease protein